MKALVLKDISPIIKKDDILIKKGNNYILEGHNKERVVPNEYIDEQSGKKILLKTPNFYTKDNVEYNKIYFELFK